MKDEVIEVLDLEHGKKVKEYWESRDADIRIKGVQEYQFSCTKQEGDKYRYYGFINGEFMNYSYEQVMIYGCEIIKLPTESKLCYDHLPNNIEAILTDFGNELLAVRGLADGVRHNEIQNYLEKLK